MIAFHSILPELATREIRCIQLLTDADAKPDPGCPDNQFHCIEFFCADLACDCRRAFIQITEAGGEQRVMASINVGWESEKFYNKRIPWEKEAGRQLVHGSLDPLNEQSEDAAEFLEMFRQAVLDTPYRLRLRRHAALLREELARRKASTTASKG
jgi:hypothetical protein